MPVASLSRANASALDHSVLHALGHMRTRAIQNTGIFSGVGAIFLILRVIPHIPIILLVVSLSELGPSFLMILRLRVVHSIYQKLISIGRRWVIDKLLFLSIRLPPLPFERTDERRTSHAGVRTPLSIPTQILSLHAVHNALALITPAPASYFSLLHWLLALASRLLRRHARPAAGARAVSCSGAMCIPSTRGFEIRIVVGKS